MPKPIEWLYFRKSCVTCKRAKGYFEPAGSEVKETVDATKVRLGPEDALALLDGIDTIIAMRGAKVEEFDLKNDRPNDETLLGKLIGPSGNLRAPTARVGRVLLVGFNEDAYRNTLQ
jgi:arsenate reductase-like glutaredoxin family protein